MCKNGPLTTNEQSWFQTIIFGFTMKFTNSPFAILDKNMNALDYQKRNLIYEDYWRREGFFQRLHKESE